MIPRRVPAVQTPVSGGALVEAALAALGGDVGRRAALPMELARTFGASGAALLDSGTSALVLALRSSVRRGDAIAMPAYGCSDLAAAAHRAGVRVRPYDIEPATLSPDLASLERALRRGASAVVLVHFFGYPSDARAVLSLARRYGALLIEDAAQSAGGSLGGVPLGAFGDFVVFSFGRGKGHGGGGGGALLAREPSLAAALERRAAAIGQGGAGWRELAAACAASALGRPSLYAIPSAIPWLRLGEMVDREAGEPRGIAKTSRVLAARAVAHASVEAERRRAIAARLRAQLAGAAHLAEVTAIDEATPGYLRLALLDVAGRGACPALGIVRPYPIALVEHAWMRALLAGGESTPMPGAMETRDRLLTLPTHHRVCERDIVRIARWLRADAFATTSAVRAEQKQLTAI